MKARMCAVSGSLGLLVIFASLTVFAQEGSEETATRSGSENPSDVDRDVELEGVEATAPVPLEKNDETSQSGEDPKKGETNDNEDAPSLSPPVSSSATDPKEMGAPLLDGMPREGAFMSGPGSLQFIIAQTSWGFASGLVTQGYANDWSVEKGGRESMLIGSLIGAGMGFGFSSWWQFNHWMSQSAATASSVNGLAGSLFSLGLMDLLSDDALLLSWTAVIGGLLGSWTTAAVGGGQIPMRHTLLMGSTAAWGVAYTALLMAILGSSGQGLRSQDVFDALAIAAGLGAGAGALATMRFDPTSQKILRADLFGAAAGAGVLLLSALVLGGFNEPTPYVLGMLASAGAMGAVSLFWDERAERVGVRSNPPGDYRNVWW